MELTSFQKKALDYSKHISLTANAGSGKTFILSKRYVEIACTENINLNNIVAITFTEKAASELYKRISKEIDEKYSASAEAGERRKLSKIRRQLVSANISTIHSFCISILKEHPLEAGIDANFLPIDPVMSKELIELSINEFINKNLGDESDENLKELLRIFGSKSLFASKVFSLIEKRKKIVSLAENLYTRSIDEIAGYFHDTFDQFFSEILDENFDEFIYSLARINDKVLGDKSDNTFALEVVPLLTKLKSATEVNEKFLVLTQITEQAFTRDLTVKARGYLKKQFQEDLSEDVNIVQEYLQKLKGFEISEQREEREKELAHFGKILTEVFLKINEIYEFRKRQGGYLDFEDLLLLAKKILLNENVKQKLGEKYKYIMIDEYQDTNEIQYEIFMPILNNLLQGNLFVVGDEKQSIYKFRDADLELFTRTKNDISNKNEGKGLLKLPHSFRVSPPIALFANKLFEELFREPKLAYNEVGASELICASKDKPGEIEFLITDKKEGPEEAEIVARKILALIKDKPELTFSDIAILCRKRNSFGELEKKFNEYNIPLNIMGGKGFYQQQIVIDVFNYLSFMTNPDNDLALTGLLRSPFFNISDTDLFKVSLEKESGFWNKLKKYSGSNNEKFDLKIKRIEENISLINKIEIGRMIRKILKESGYWSIIADSQNADQDIANLNKLIRVANNYSTQSYKTVFDFLEYLKDSMESLSDEGQAAVDSGNEAVQIMTIHQSKGLEFKAVFLYNCNDTVESSKIIAKSVSVDGKFGILTKLPPEKNYFLKYEAAPVVNMVDYIEGKKEVAEVKRLLYVAVTRAVNYLFISATKGKSFSKNSFIDLIYKGLKIDEESDYHLLIGGLKFLQDANTDVEESLQVRIPINDSVDLQEIPEPDKNQEKGKQIILSQQIDDYAKREIISASKVAVFSQCKRKYELTYEFGYSKLFMKFYDLINNYEFHAKEEDSAGSLSAVKGRVIHKVLEEEIAPERISEFIPKYINEETGDLIVTEEDKNNLLKIISTDLEKYYESESYKYIKEFSEYYNEFEVYSKEGENYLYGIIDKLIFADDKAAIVDYKTDDIEKDEINERGEIYLPQLQFYAYLISKLYPEKRKFEVRLIFIKHPEKNFVKEYSVEEITEFKNVIDNYVTSIKNKTFEENRKHCHKCYFFLNKKMCIYDKVNN